MRRSRPHGSVVLGTVAVLTALSACSGGDGGNDGGTDDAKGPPSASASASTSRSPSGSASPGASPSRTEEARIEKAEDLDRKCRTMEKGLPEAAEYTGNGPHTMAVFVGEYDSDTDLTSPYTFQQVRFSGAEVVKESHDATEVELLACGDGTRGTRRVGSCDYMGFGGARGGEKPLYAQTYEFTVYQLRTGKVVKTLRTSSGAGPYACPYRLKKGLLGGRQPSKVYARLSQTRTENLLRELVTGPAR